MSKPEPQMAFSEAELRQLEAWLASPALRDQAMSVDAMQGLFCAVASAPDLIPPSVWLPVVLGDTTGLENVQQLQEVLDLIQGFYNATVAELMEGNGITLELFTDDDGEEDYSLWCLGYLEGVALSQQNWLEEGEELAELLFPISVLSGVAREMALEAGDAWAEGEQERELMEACQEELVDAVIDIHRYWLVRRAEPPVRRSSPKVGRNDPCPCGSGKKYKHCCGAGPQLH